MIWFHFSKGHLKNIKIFLKIKDIFFCKHNSSLKTNHDLYSFINILQVFTLLLPFQITNVPNGSHVLFTPSRFFTYLRLPKKKSIKQKYKANFMCIFAKIMITAEPLFTGNISLEPYNITLAADYHHKSHININMSVLNSRIVFYD